MGKPVNIEECFQRFSDTFSPKIVGELNGQHVKLAKLKGKFVWHEHEAEDELFMVIKGRLIISLRDRDITLEEGEFVIVPRGVEHCPVADEEVQVLMFEPIATSHTGNVQSEKTVDKLGMI